MASASPDKLSRREREALQRKAEILEAAEEVFSEHGYHAASMEEVARRAEFSVGTLYNFFKNKEEMYIEMLHRRVDEFEPILAEALQTGETPLDRLRNFFLRRFDVAWNNPRFLRIYYHETMGTQFDHRAGLTPEVMDRYEKFLKTLEGVFAEAIKAGQFVPGSPALMVTIFIGAMHQALIHFLKNPGGKRQKKLERELFELIINGLGAKQRAKG